MLTLMASLISLGQFPFVNFYVIYKKDRDYDNVVTNSMDELDIERSLTGVP